MCLFAVSALADGEPREVLSFSTVSNVGVTKSVFVAGSDPDLGAWTSTGAVKLLWTSGNVWSGQVAVRRGQAVEFKYVARLTASDQFCNVANIEWPSSPNQATSTTALASAPYAAKTIYYFSGWTSVLLRVYTNGTNFADTPLTQVSTGRTAGEYLYRGTAGAPGGSLEFVLHNGAGQYDKAPYGGYGDSNYFTRLDALVVQDGQLYNYWPAPAVSGPRIVTNFVNSTAPDSRVSGRVARIYLPRGYDEHTWKRYPVMFFHDGQNVFEDSRSASSAPNAWQLDRIATREISQGRLRETIFVGLDNTGSRQFEYNAPTDTYPGQPAGIGNSYLHFLGNNAYPMMAYDFRSLADPRNTLVGGSSMGGLISIYAAYETNLFGGVLAISPALTRATNYTAALWSRSKRPTRFYLDTGTSEGQVGPTPGGNYWEMPWEGYSILLAQGYAANEDVTMRAGCGHEHNELAWRERLPGALAFLLDVREEPSAVLRGEQPPRLAGAPTGALSLASLHRHVYTLEKTSGLDSHWQGIATSSVERLPWGTVTLTNTASADGVVFLRAAATPAP